MNYILQALQIVPTYEINRTLKYLDYSIALSVYYPLKDLVTLRSLSQTSPLMGVFILAMLVLGNND